VLIGERSKLRATLTLVASVASAITWVAPDWSRFALLHAHNCVPIVVWIAWRRRPPIFSAVVAGLFLIVVLAIFTGCFDGLPLRRPFSDHVFSITRIIDAVAVGFGGPWRVRWLLFFAFTQAVHYAIWLRLIPEEARDRETPRTFAASWRAFREDSGPIVARAMLIATLAVPLLAIVAGVVRVRAFYVTASEFHATVEVILLVVLAAGRSSPSRA
jgi:hypothetical protein